VALRVSFFWISSLFSFGISCRTSGQVFSQPSKLLGGRLDHHSNQEVLGRMAGCGRLRRQQASGWQDQGPSARALSEVRASRQWVRPVQIASLARSFCARRVSGIPPIYDCVRPRLEGSAWNHGPSAVEKNAAKRTMGRLGVFQPFTHYHCEIASPGQSGMLVAQDPQTPPFWPLALAAAGRQWRKNARKCSADAS
jgi:hypothetical protein